MRRFFSVLFIVLMAAGLCSCGKDEEIPAESAEKSAFFVADDDVSNIVAEDIPEEYFEVPSDWIEISQNGLHLSVPADVHPKSEYSSFYIDDAHDSGEDGIIILFGYVDWADFSAEDDNDDEELTDALAELGYDYDGSRYSLYNAILSFTEDDRTAENSDALDIVLENKQDVFVAFTNAYVLEKGGYPIFIHEYGGNECKYWVNIMQTDNYEVSAMVSAQDKDTALRIAASAELE